MANKKHLLILQKGVQNWNNWRLENPEIYPNLKRSQLKSFNLQGANFKNTDLSHANLIEADLSFADLQRADLTDAKLINARLGKVNLMGASLLRTNFQLANLRGANFSRSHIIQTIFHLANLDEANLERATLAGSPHWDGLNISSVNINNASFYQANLKGADLRWQNIGSQNFRRANLSGANLSFVQAMGTNFREANLTGACIENWNIDNNTDLTDVFCDYIFQKENQKERRPHDLAKIFNRGEFTKLYQKVLETVDLIFKDGIDWEIFLASFNRIRVKTDIQELSIQAIEKKTGGAFVIRVETPINTNKAEIESSFWKQYQPLLESKEEQLRLYCRELELKRQENTRLLDIVEILAKKDAYQTNITIGNYAPDSQGNNLVSGQAIQDNKFSNSNLSNPDQNANDL